MAEKLYHVLGLNEGAQDTLCMLLLNMHNLFVYKQMETLAVNGNHEEISYRHGLVGRHLDKIMEIIVSIKESSRPYKAMFFNDIAMELIVKAVTVFHPTDNCLTDDEIGYMDQHFKPLADLVNESLTHTYTREELEKAGVT